MITLDFDSVRIDRLITHFVGNPMREEDLILSNGYTEIHEDSMIFLLKYLVMPFKPLDFYNFLPTTEDGKLDVLTAVKQIFEDPTTLPKSSIAYRKYFVKLKS